MRAIWTMARLDLAVWRRSPWAIAAAVIPPLGMLVLVKVLTLAVTVQPVALVIEDHGPQSFIVAEFIADDTESYQLRVTDRARAERLLEHQKVVAVVDIPKGFHAAATRGHAVLPYTLNNVDIAETDLRKTDVPFDTYQTLPVLLLLIIVVGVLGGALLGSRDHERRTITFLRQAPISRASFVLGRLLGALLATSTVVVPVVAYLTWNGTIDPPPGHWPPFLAVLAATAILSAALGVVLGLVLRRSTTVALAGVTVATYLFFLGGGFTTIAFLPAWLRALSRAVPTRYAIDGMRQTLFYPDLRGLTTDLLVLGAFAAAALACGVVALGRSAR